MTYKVCYWDSEVGAQRERDCTPEEVAEIEARINQPLDRAALAAQIDAAVAAIYAKPITFSKEYEDREAEALAYKAAGYVGDVPPRVKGFADPAGFAPPNGAGYQAATDLILAQAAQLRGALPLLSDLRMRKYEVLRAATDEAAQAAFDQITASIQAIGAALA
jgi:hypothetical protein